MIGKKYKDLTNIQRTTRRKKEPEIEEEETEEEEVEEEEVEEEEEVPEIEKKNNVPRISVTPEELLDLMEGHCSRTLNLIRILRR